MVDEELLAEYLEETVAGCEKDPSFATGRNLVTYGVYLMMESKSNEGFIAGIKVLGGAIKDDWPSGRKVQAKHLLTRSDSSSHMIQRLLEIVGPRSPYSIEVREHAARIVALVARGIHTEQFPEVIECISFVLDNRFDRIHQHGHNQHEDYEGVELLERYELEYLNHEIRSPDSPDFSLSSLLQRLAQCLPCRRTSGSSEREGSWIKNTVHGIGSRLLEEAVKIINQLAVDDNRRVLSNAVLNKFAMAPLKHHMNNHNAILDNYWVRWVVAAIKEANSQGQILEAGQTQTAAPSGRGGRASGKDIQEEGEGERLLQSSIVGPALGNKIINNIKSIIRSTFDCLDCGGKQKRQGIETLVYLSLDMFFIMDTESRTRRLTWTLLLMCCSTDDESYGTRPESSFIDWNMPDFSSIRLLAYEKLWDMLRDKHELPSEESAR